MSPEGEDGGARETEETDKQPTPDGGSTQDDEGGAACSRVEEATCAAGGQGSRWPEGPTCAARGQGARGGDGPSAAGPLDPWLAGSLAASRLICGLGVAAQETGHAAASGNGCGSVWALGATALETAPAPTTPVLRMARTRACSATATSKTWSTCGVAATTAARSLRMYASRPSSARWWSMAGGGELTARGGGSVPGGSVPANTMPGKPHCGSTHCGPGAAPSADVAGASA